MKKLSGKDWIFDSLVIAGLTGIAIFVVPWLAACFLRLSLHLGHALFRFRLIVFGDFLPHIIVGALLGITTASLMRHRKLSLALLPAVLFSVFNLLYFVFGAEPYSWGGVLWLDAVVVGNWVLLILASFVGARFALRKRQRNTTELTPTASLACGGSNYTT